MSRYLVWRRTAPCTLTKHPPTEVLGAGCWGKTSEPLTPAPETQHPLSLVLRERVLGGLGQLVERLLGRPAVDDHARHCRDQRLAIAELRVRLRRLARVALENAGLGGVQEALALGVLPDL